MTYGDVAHALGSRAPRQVGQVLAHYGHAVPWWRVVPVSGKPPHGHAADALIHYREEGTPIIARDTPEHYGLRLSSARLSPTHAIYDGALELQHEQRMRSGLDVDDWEHS